MGEKLKRDYVIIKDWAGNTLADCHKDDPEVDRILDLNRDAEGECPDIYVTWKDESRTDNVYEFVNY